MTMWRTWHNRKKQHQRDRLVNKWLDGDLTAAEESELTRLTQSDPQLSDRLHALALTHQLLHKLPTVSDEQSGFTDSVMSRITQTAAAPVVVPPWHAVALKWGGLTTIVGVAGVLAIIFVQAPPLDDDQRDQYLHAVTEHAPLTLTTGVAPAPHQPATHLGKDQQKIISDDKVASLGSNDARLSKKEPVPAAQFSMTDTMEDMEMASSAEKATAPPAREPVLQDSAHAEEGVFGGRARPQTSINAHPVTSLPKRSRMSKDPSTEVTQQAAQFSESMKLDRLAAREQRVLDRQADQPHRLSLPETIPMSELPSSEIEKEPLFETDELFPETMIVVSDSPAPAPPAAEHMEEEKMFIETTWSVSEVLAGDPQVVRFVCPQHKSPMNVIIGVSELDTMAEQLIRVLSEIEFVTDWQRKSNLVLVRVAADTPTIQQELTELFESVPEQTISPESLPIAYAFDQELAASFAQSITVSPTDWTLLIVLKTELIDIERNNQ